MACGRPTRGSNPKDDTIPCGTKLYLGTESSNRKQTVLLCEKCKAETVALEAATAP